MNGNLSPTLNCTISNNFEVYEEPVPRAKQIPQCAVKFEAVEDNKIVCVSLYWFILPFQKSLDSPIIFGYDDLFDRFHYTYSTLILAC